MKEKINLIESKRIEITKDGNQEKKSVQSQNPISTFTTFHNIQSQIVKEEELYLIDEGIKKNFNKKIKKYKLLYRASRDGFEAKDFHSKCDNNSFTVTFVKTKGGKRFGGFTDATWESKYCYKQGSKGFIFSFDNNEIYYNKDSLYNIQCDSDYGPTFGEKDFYISNNCNKNNKSSEHSDQSYETNGREHVLTGASNFYVENYEVYKIILE